ncbi:MAG: sulfur carrier protein ThiS [Nitrospinae bacterium]|nr:sulfur carrier protein ThiS [Nitrospinota bacterium]
MLKFHLNGEPKEKNEGTTIVMLIEDLNLPPRSVIVEYNNEFLERELFGYTVLKEGDSVEIIRAIAGG